MFPLCKYLDDLVTDLSRLAPAALEKFDEEAIHKSRVATRRLKAAIELLEPVLDKNHVKPFAKIGRRIRHRLGPLRDIDVMLNHLDDIKPTSPHADAADWLREQLADDRDAARDKSRGKIPSGKILSRLATWKTLREDVIAAQEAVPSLLAESLHLQLDRFIEHAAQIKNAHELRIAGKALRYTVELAKADKHKLPSDVLRTFKSMQDSLGTWHDYVVLAECAMRVSVDQELPLKNSALQRQVLSFASYCMSRADRSLGHFTQLWNERGQQLCDAIRAAMPLTQSPTPPQQQIIPPQTDPDPLDSPEPSLPEVVEPAPPPAA
ncbi:MAG TPA: CHAD domain-containing protein [Tepidisphaeraceae bacterium]|nr:CHAD domain-containing protein [Tepidisphaeraceae bacterium]